MQIHPTTLYSEKPGRRFLISESVRGEGAVLYDKDGMPLCRRTSAERCGDGGNPGADEKRSERILSGFLWNLLGEKTILEHFPNIRRRCLEEGYDVAKQWIPVVPAQHYFMGGIWVDSDSRTSMQRLFAVGETSCNGVHGANRLASNSLLESLVFAKRAAEKIAGDRKR